MICSINFTYLVSHNIVEFFQLVMKCYVLALCFPEEVDARYYYDFVCILTGQSDSFAVFYRAAKAKIAELKDEAARAAKAEKDNRRFSKAFTLYAQIIIHSMKQIRLARKT